MIDNAELLKRVKNGDEKALSEMTQNNMGLVIKIALTFKDRNIEFEDLVQLGSIGLLKAIKNFDFSFGVQFSTYAVPMISGEIRRFLRDDGMIKISRSVKETAYKGRAIEDEIRRKTGREPTISETAKLCERTVEELLYAYEACSGYDSLSQFYGSSNLDKESRLGTNSHEEETINKIWISECLNALKPRERQIIVFRYMKNLTQTKIAEILGISQVQVSRIEKKSLEEIRKIMTTS